MENNLETWCERLLEMQFDVCHSYETQLDEQEIDHY
jgi:hypothetical protein